MSQPDPSPADRSGPLASAPAAARTVLHLVFVVDASGSMTGERINALNWAARAAIPAVREAAAEHPEVEVLVRVIRFGDDVAWPVPTPTPVADFTWVSLTAGGETPMGAALAALAGALAGPDIVPADNLPPVIVLLSDGLPTDDAAAGIAALAATELGARAVRIPIAIGPDADLELLAAFSGDPALRPLRANNAEMLVSHMRWAASAPIGRPAAVATATASGPAETEADGGLVW